MTTTAQETHEFEPSEQHCGHCDGLLVWGFNSYVHADPNTECLAFGGRQLQPAGDTASTEATEGETCMWLSKSEGGHSYGVYLTTCGGTVPFGMKLPHQVYCHFCGKVISHE